MDLQTEIASRGTTKPIRRSLVLDITGMVMVGLCIVYIAQCVWFIRTQSFTYDEPIHIAEGLEAWRSHRFQMWNDHPPLARLWCSLPLLNRGWEIDVLQLANGFDIKGIKPDPEAMAWRARSMNVVFGLALAWTLWVTARRMFSIGAANLAVALFVFSPSLITHFSLATTDGAATLFIFATSAYLLWWRQYPSVRNTVWSGVLLGLLLLAKFSTPVMFVLAVGWMLVLKPQRIVANPFKWNWGKTIGAVLIALVVVWAGYFFHVSRLILHDGQLTTTFPNRPSVVYRNVKSKLNLNLPVPAGEYLEGLRSVVRHNRMGQAAFFLGQVSRRGGFKLYYPVAILLKWPTVALILFGLGLILLLGRFVRGPSGLWLMASFPIVYLGFAIFARFDIGDRHVLPVYPFVLLVAAAVWEVANKGRATVALVLLAVAVQAADGLRYAPDYLSYFNVFVRPAESYKLLTDSNLDWGQGLISLRKYEDTHPGETIWLAYFGSVEAKVYGIRARPLGEGERETGTIVVSATNLSGQFLKDPEGYHWVLQYPRMQILDNSLHVLKVPAR